MKIFLVRHGETDWNRNHKLQGQSDTELNSYGIELAEKTAEGLKNIPFDHAYASPLKRAVSTAEIILQNRPVALHTDKRMMEMCFGDGEGAYLPDIMKNPEEPLYNFLKEPGQYVPPRHGESFLELYKRSADFAGEILPSLENVCKNLLLVAHGAWNRSMINPYLEIPVSQFWEVALPNCSVTVLEYQSGKISVLEKSRVFYTI